MVQDQLDEHPGKADLQSNMVLVRWTWQARLILMLAMLRVGREVCVVAACRDTKSLRVRAKHRLLGKRYQRSEELSSLAVRKTPGA